jgi:hypothetical protein
MVADAFVARDGFSPGAKNESQSRSTGKVLMGVIRWRDATSPVVIVVVDGDIMVVVKIDRGVMVKRG